MSRWNLTLPGCSPDSFTMPRVSNKIWGASLSAIVAGLFAVSFMATGAAASSSPVAAAAAGAEPTELKIGEHSLEGQRSARLQSVS